MKLFKKVLDTGSIPEDWLTGIIVPIYKNAGDVKDVNNYRGITILSCLGKLFTTVLNARLTKFCNDNFVVKEIQAGFREGYTTMDHVFVIRNLIDLFLSKKKKLFCLYIDYKKAFDLVWRDGLWHKLLKEGIDGKVIRVIKNMYCNIKSCVSLNNEFSDYFVSYTGVRQGENLSPLLFSLYVNDLEEHLLENNCNYIQFCDKWMDDMLRVLVLLYADDTVVLAQDENGIHNALTAMESYCEKWKLHINCKKTKITIFSKEKCDSLNFNFQFKGENIDIVEHYKYLGVILNYNGSFKTCQEQLCQQGRRAMYSLIAKCRKFDLPIDLQLELFDAMVLPIITYGCEIWGYRVVKDVENVHITFLKHILNVRKTTCNAMVYGELGKYPISVHIKSRMVNYWCKLLNDKKDKFCYVMYQCLFRLYTENTHKSQWLIYIKSLLDNSGLSGIWLDQAVNNQLWLKLAYVRIIKDQWITEWRATLRSKTSCNTYALCKDNFCLEKYLTSLPKPSRISLCKFRTNNHRLPVVTGRFSRTPREERFCTKCDGGYLGDEYHVMLECSNEAITALRLRYVPRYYRNYPSRQKFVQLLQENRFKIMYDVALFIKSVLLMFRYI